MKILVNIDVPELSPAITFYCAALGLQHSRMLDEHVAELTGASSVIYFASSLRRNGISAVSRVAPLLQALDSSSYGFRS